MPLFSCLVLNIEHTSHTSKSSHVYDLNFSHMRKRRTVYIITKTWFHKAPNHYSFIFQKKFNIFKATNAKKKTHRNTWLLNWSKYMNVNKTVLNFLMKLFWKQIISKHINLICNSSLLLQLVTLYVNEHLEFKKSFSSDTF